MERFTQIRLLSFDRVAFAHSLTAEDYRYELDAQGYSIYGPTPENGGVLEIGFVERGPILLKDAEGTFRVGENCIFILPPGSRFSVETEKPGIHSHTTAEFLIRAECAPADGLQPPAEGVVTLPLVIPPNPGSSEVFSLIRGIAVADRAQLQRSWFAQCADLMLLLSKLSAMAAGSAAEPGKKRYCQRAKTFITENIHRHLTVGEIAEHLGISKNYLTTIFKDCEGISVTEFTNRSKLGYMLELIRRYDYTIAEASSHVGFHDADYVSRLFKKYHGVTLSQYRSAMEKKG